MDRLDRTPDWSLIRAFLAVAETGSLSAGARALGISQPTMGRQIAGLENSLGTSLFQRRPRGMALTDAGTELLEPAQAMRAAATRLEIAAAGKSENLAGTVRITASLFMSHHVLPPVFAELRAKLPEISIELVASDTSENLLFREADIAIRMYRPKQLNVVARHLGDVRLGLFGAKSYFERKGRPNSIAELMDHDFVGYDRNEDIIHGMRAIGWDVDRDWFAVRCDHQTTNWELVRAGCGLGFGQVTTALADETVEQIGIDLPIPALPVWLTAHQAMRATPRIRRVWDHLAQRLVPLIS